MPPGPEEDKIPRSHWPASIAAGAIPAIVYLAAVALFIKDGFALLDFPLDDAWIHRVYSRALAFGHGLAYNIGQQEAGSSSPLWSMLTAPAHWLGALGTDAVVLAVKAIGVLLGLCTVLSVQRLAHRLGGSRATAVLAAALFGLDPRLLFSALSGMETCLLVAVLTGACLALTARRPLWFLTLIGLAPVIRPEAAVLLPFALTGVAMVLKSDRRPAAKALACSLPVLPAALWSGFCLGATGHVLPNTFYMKAHGFAIGASELGLGLRAVAQHALVTPWLMAAGVAVFVFLCLTRAEHSMPSLLLLVAAPALYVLGVVGSRRVILDGYYWTRWVDPASLLLTAASCIGLAHLLTIVFTSTESKKRAEKAWPPWTRALISLAGLAGLLLSVPTYVASLTDRRDHLASDSRVIATMNVQMGQWIKENTAEDAVVGVNDAGAIRYFGERRTIDLLGLNTADIAFGRIGVDEAIARSDWLVIFPELFRRVGKLEEILVDFEPCIEVRVPLEEYTICNEPAQTLKTAFRRKAPPITSGGNRGSEIDGSNLDQRHHAT